MAVITATAMLTGTRWGLRERKLMDQDFFLERMGRSAFSIAKDSSFPHLSSTNPAWVVRTESNVRKEAKKPPDPPCVVCRGRGLADCHRCSGQGRTNCVHLRMLPRGEWPKWCRTCGGSGLAYCSRCFGTGEYRAKMGFHFFETDSDDTTAQEQQPPSPRNTRPPSAD